MTNSEYYKILKRFFIRWNKERNKWDAWKNMFTTYNSFEKTLQSCASYDCNIYSQLHFAYIDFDHYRYGVPFGVTTSYKGFSINMVYGDRETAYYMGTIFKQDFLKHLQTLKTKKDAA